MEKQNENTPVEGKSYVQEFLEEVRDDDGNYQKLLGEDCIEQGMTTDTFQGFCQELQALQKMREAVSEYTEYLKTKK